MSEGVVCDYAGQVIILGRLGTHKFTSRRCVEKQVPDGHRCARIAGRILNIEQTSGFDNYAGGGIVGFCLCCQFDFCDRRNRR